MPQLSLYVDDVTMDEMRTSASAEGVSLSRYAAGAIRERLDAPHHAVSTGYWDKLYGCLADDDSFVRPTQLETRAVPALDL